MKKLLSISLFSLLGFSLIQAQTFESYQAKHELSVNAQGIFSSIGPFGFFFAEPQDQFQPLLRYRFYINDHAFRAGVNGFSRNNDSFASDSSTQDGLSQSLSAFLGYEYTFTTYGRFQAYAGIDGIWSIESSSSLSNFPDRDRESRYETERMRSGARPFLGFRVYITPRISISTEMGCLAVQESFKSNSFRSWQEPMEVTSEGSSFNITYSAPRIVYLDFKL